MRRKGSISDTFFIAIMLFITAITFVVGWMMMSKVNIEFQATDNIAQVGKDIVSDTTSRYVSWFDGIYLTVLVLLWIVTLVLASKINVHPVFFMFTILIYGILVIITAALGNAFYTFASNAQITEYADAFTFIPFIMNNFVATMVILGFSVAIVMYAKVRG